MTLRVSNTVVTSVFDYLQNILSKLKLDLSNKEEIVETYSQIFMPAIINEKFITKLTCELMILDIREILELNTRTGLLSSLIESYSGGGKLGEGGELGADSIEVITTTSGTSDANGTSKHSFKYNPEKDYIIATKNQIERISNIDAMKKYKSILAIMLVYPDNDTLYDALKYFRGKYFIFFGEYSDFEDTLYSTGTRFVFYKRIRREYFMNLERGECFIYKSKAWNF